jgi:TetR/AcrR family transcriptional regulator, transcriptional repressor for nem operon
MKTTSDEKKRLRAKILKAAAPFLKKHGQHAAPVDEIMEAAGVTSGALYSHFENKDELCHQAICGDLDERNQRWAAAVRAHGSDGLKRIVGDYLSERSVGAMAGGCTFAALGADMARAKAVARRAYGARIATTLEIFAAGLSSGTPKERQARAQLLLSSMVGATTVVRALADPALAREYLAQLRTRLLREIV